MSATLILAVTCFGAFIFFMIKTLGLVLNEKASNYLMACLFPHGKSQMEDTLQAFNKLTNERFTNAELLDYFLKIKGLQTLNLNDPINFYTRRYLLQPTRIRLNYFEQVKFYESFLNYPEIQGIQESGGYTAKPGHSRRGVVNMA